MSVSDKSSYHCLTAYLPQQLPSIYDFNSSSLNQVCHLAGFNKFSSTLPSLHEVSKTEFLQTLNYSDEVRNSVMRFLKVGGRHNFERSRPSHVFYGLLQKNKNNWATSRARAPGATNASVFI